jgi:nitroreductase
MNADTSQAVRPLTRTRQFRQFTNEPVSQEQLTALAEAARWTGSGGNWQPWRLIIVTDEQLLRQIAEAALPQTRSLMTAMAAIAIALPREPGKDVITAYDEGRLAERVLVAASMLGIGTGIGWIRDEFRENVDRLLGTPADRFVRTIIAIGHPTQQARAYKQAPGEARLPLDELVTWR